jgi:hypothetical protein
MADREVSWGDEEEEIIIISVPAVKTPTATEPVKKLKEPLQVPTWSIDTNGDLPMEQAVSHSAAHVASVPSWPEEEAYTSATIDYDPAPVKELPPLTRDTGRDTVSNGLRPGRGGDRSERNERREDRPPRSDRPSRSRLDDLSTLNLPGVDLHKMPQATTRLSFSNGRNGGDDREHRPRRDDRREDRREDRRGGYESVQKITKEVEELGWDESAEIPAARTAPAETSRTEELSWGDEQEINEPVRVFEAVRNPQEAAEPVRAVEPVFESQASVAAPVKVTNTTSRLEDDGWGDEPENVSAPIKISEPVKVTELVKVTEPVKVADPVKVSKQSEPVAFPIHVPAPSAAAALIDSPASSEQLPVQHPHAHPMVMSPYGAQMPYMMNPMSPVGHMPMMPMSMMPGMMMPIWVTCPFCYHCYMYPPIAPGAGPAPGVSQISPTQ